jgi:hypothetical protein
MENGKHSSDDHGRMAVDEYGGDVLRRTRVGSRLRSPIAHFNPSHPRISPLTAGRDRPYAFGLAAALVSQGLTIDFIGSDEVDGTEWHRNPDYDASRWWRSNEGVRGECLIFNSHAFA